MRREIPLEFVRRYCALTWREVGLGVREQWLRCGDAVDLAVERVMRGDDVGAEAAALACLLKEDVDEVCEALARLVQDKPGNTEAEARMSWLRVLLAWLYEHQASFPEPLAIIEELYAAFGYPQEIRHLIRYNAPPDSEPLSALGEPALLRQWAKYVTDSRLQ